MTDRIWTAEEIEAVAALLADPTGRYRFNDTFAAMLRQQAARIKEIEAQNKKLDELVSELVRAIDDTLDLINDSDGVYGYHLNGDPAPWASLDLKISNDLSLRARRISYGQEEEADVTN